MYVFVYSLLFVIVFLINNFFVTVECRVEWRACNILPRLLFGAWFPEWLS